jgi:hypothetical protein
MEEILGDCLNDTERAPRGKCILAAGGSPRIGLTAKSRTPNDFGDAHHSGPQKG